MQRIDLIGQMLLWLQYMTRPTEIRLFVGFLPPAAVEEPSPSKQVPSVSETLPFGMREISSRLNVHSEGGLNE